MHSSSSNHLLRILDTKQIGTKNTFLGTECYCMKGHTIMPAYIIAMLHQHVDYV